MAYGAGQWFILRLGKLVGSEIGSQRSGIRVAGLAMTIPGLCKVSNYKELKV